MLWVPNAGRIRIESTLGTVGSSNWGTAVTTGASASTKGTPVELIAATAFDAYWIEVYTADYARDVTASQGALDILAGAATEDILIPDLLMGYSIRYDTGVSAFCKSWAFPLYIPAGTRIAAQAAGARVSSALRVAVVLRGGSGIPPFRVGRKVTTYGMGTVPDGTAITPGQSGANGTYTQIVASTTEDHFAFMPSFQPTGDTSLLSRIYCVALGIGAATEDEIGQWFYRTSVLEEMSGAMPNFPAFADVPAGTRLALRASNDNTNDTGYNAVIHAVS